MFSSAISTKTGEAYGLHNGQRGCGAMGRFPSLHYLSSRGWAHPRRCEKGKPLADTHSRRKACRFAQRKEEALIFAFFIRLNLQQVRI